MMDSSTSVEGAGSSSAFKASRSVPKKGILKNQPSRSSIDFTDAPSATLQEVAHSPPQSSEAYKKMHWDEMNILATYHPLDKDYGFMKVNEPSTPYHQPCEDMSEDEGDGIDADKLQKQLNINATSLPKFLQNQGSSLTDEEDEDSSKHHNPQFEAHRKAHYDEFKMAKLLQSQLKDDEEDDESQSKRRTANNCKDNDEEMA